jgi:hypothetical protein
VLEARYFDTSTPLPERFGTVWSGEGIAVLLRRHETSAQEKSEVFVKSATDENGIDLKPNSSQVEFLRREEVEANSVKTLYSIWSAVLKPSPSATPQLTVDLQVNAYGAPKSSHIFEGLQLRMPRP